MAEEKQNPPKPQAQKSQEDDKPKGQEPSKDNALGADDDAFIGVSPEYRNYANEADKPLLAQEGDDADLEKEALERDQEEDASDGPADLSDSDRFKGDGKKK